MNTKGHCYPKSIIQQAVYFKLRFTLSYRDVEEIMKMRGVHVDHATIQRWVFKFTPFIESEMKKRKVKVGKSGSNTAAIKVYNKRSFSNIKIRQCKYLNNIVKQDHRFIKWRIQNWLGFKNFESARRTLSGIEVVHIIRKHQMIGPGTTMFKSFCKLAC
jgi:transposase-like protein